MIAMLPMQQVELYSVVWSLCECMNRIAVASHILVLLFWHKIRHTHQNVLHISEKDQSITFV